MTYCEHSKMGVNSGMENRLHLICNDGLSLGASVSFWALSSRLYTVQVSFFDRGLKLKSCFPLRPNITNLHKLTICPRLLFYPLISLHYPLDHSSKCVNLVYTLIDIYNIADIFYVNPNFMEGGKQI